MGAGRPTLTVKQEKYAQALFKGMSQREAYKEAYDCQNMTDKCIDEEACVLAANPKVSQRLDELTDELKYRNMATKEKVLAELARIAFDDIGNYLSYKTVKTVVGHDKHTGEPIIDYKTVIELKDSEEIDTRNIAEVQQGPNGTFKFKQYCKDNALVQLGKHLGMFVEKIDLNATGPLQVTFTRPEE
jgi:phage terminase small subunit